MCICKKNILLGLLLFTWGFAATTNLKSFENNFYRENFVRTFLVSSSIEKERSFFIVLYAPDRYFFHVHRLNSKVQILEEQKKNVTLGVLSENQAKSLVENIFGISIQNVVKIGIQDVFTILQNLGGVATFNLESTTYPKGRVVIDENNFSPFLNGIANTNMRKDIAFSLVISILQKSLQLDKDLFQKKTIAFYKKWKPMWLDLSKNVDRITLTYSRMNVIESFSQGAVKGKTIPLTISGKIYDRKKIFSIIEKMNSSEEELESTITVQVRNTTNIPRLAAKTSGFLQRKKFLVSEFLNSPITMKNSLIINRTISPKKLHQIQKYTKIRESYYIADYRESADFALYLANDFFMIKQEGGKSD